MIQKGDFVEVDFAGFLEDGMLFDTTLKDVATKHGLQGRDFKPAIICVGERHVVAGLDEALIGKPIGAFHLDVPAEKAFGKKDTKLLKLIPRTKFLKDDIQPFAGLEVSIDGSHGTIRTVSGGRVIVDFNHPLAGHDLHYDVTVRRIISDGKEQVEAALNLMGIPFHSVAIEGKKALVEMHDFPPELQKSLAGELTRLTSLDSVEFKAQPLNTQPKKKDLHEKGG